MTSPSFDGVAAEYDVVRPDYPGPLFDAIESAMGQPLLWSQACDVGAGTGIASRALAGRGATVTAVDRGEGMLRVLKARSTSRVRAVVGDGNALPLASGTFDLVTYAQSFHWTDPARSLAEAFRVLRPGALLAVWWNRHDRSVPWYARHEERLFRACGWPGPDEGATLAEDLAAPPWNRRVATVSLPWSRRISLRDLGRTIRTKSYVIALGDRADEVVEAELGLLAGEHPDGHVDEPFTTYAVLARA